MTAQNIRRARPDDVAAIVRMLAGDQLGAARDTPDDLEPYLRAFERIVADPNQFLVVATTAAGEPIATLQRRAGAHRFYERLGFVPSHTGFKLKL